MTDSSDNAAPPAGSAGRGHGADTAPLSPDEVGIHLEKLLAGEALKGSERLRRFLRLVVTETLAGRGDRLKEYVLAVEVFDRPDAFDPRIEPVVRVEARRLRAKLADYYSTEGPFDEVVIDLPKGSCAGRRSCCSRLASSPPSPSRRGSP